MAPSQLPSAGCEQLKVSPSGHLPSWPPAACLSDASALGDIAKQHEKVGEVVDIESFQAASLWGFHGGGGWSGQVNETPES